MEPSSVQEQPAIVGGQPMHQLPEDLFIPPDALRVFLEAFQGPLDLLLYLIKKQNLDILEIPIVEITHQYLEYIDLMKTLRMDLAGEYLLMAAMLAEIKSRFLLPRPETDEDGEEIEDPRAELVRRLQEYERFKHAAQALDEMPRMERDCQPVAADQPTMDLSECVVDVDLKDLFAALADVMKRAALYSHHKILGESLSIRDRMTDILGRVNMQSFIEFADLFSPEEGRVGVVVTLIALLELTRQSTLELVQNESHGPIYVKAKVDATTDVVVEDEYES